MAGEVCDRPEMIGATYAYRPDAVFLRALSADVYRSLGEALPQSVLSVQEDQRPGVA